MTADIAPLGITGATGRLGGRIARRLAAAGVGQRLLARDPSRAPTLPGATAAYASFADAESVTAALTGVRTALMVSASESRNRLDEHFAFVEGAARAGVEHLVYISFFGAAPDCTFTLGRDHFATEQRIRASGMGFTFLRDNFYSDFMLAMVGEDRVIRGPAGDGRVSAVAQDDIADAAAAVLTWPAAHLGATYSLTGPEALNLEDVAGILSAATGRSISYHPETVPEAYASRAVYKAPDWQVDAWVSTYTAIAAGEVADVTDDIARLSGHEATSLPELLWRGGSAY